MSRALSIALAQLNWLVGDIEGNAQRMLHTINEQQQAGADIVMFSELALTGYPPEDLLYRDDLYQRCDEQLARLQAASSDIAIIVGHPFKQSGQIYNALSLFWQGNLVTRYYKQQLPNYGVFDEKRYFNADNKTRFIEFKGYRLGLLICEDLWFNGPVDELKAANVDMILSINASPYNREKPYIRNQLLSEHCRRTGLPLIYLNQVGGQDELIFDGCSKVFDASGDMTHRLAAFQEQILQVKFNNTWIEPMPDLAPQACDLSLIYDALVLAVRDYVTKNGFKGVILGLSGGIDSALTLAIAVDALGKDKVQAVMMPFRYTAEMSIHDAREEAEILGVEFDIISIEMLQR